MDILNFKSCQGMDTFLLNNNRIKLCCFFLSVHRENSGNGGENISTGYCYRIGKSSIRVINLHIDVINMATFFLENPRKP